MTSEPQGAPTNPALARAEEAEGLAKRLSGWFGPDDDLDFEQASTIGRGVKVMRELAADLRAVLEREKRLRKENDDAAREAFILADDLRMRLQEVEAARAEAVVALQRSMTALDDWINTYAPEFCKPERVEEARKRIWENGTLAYIAEVQEDNRAAIRAYRELAR